MSVSDGNATLDPTIDGEEFGNRNGTRAEVQIAVEPTSSKAYRGLDSYVAEDDADIEFENELSDESDEEVSSFDGTDFLYMLLVGGLPGLIVGFTAGLMCAGLAVLINVVHNLLPFYVFVAPLFILFFMAVAPAVYGIGVGTGIGYFAKLLKSRDAGSASFAGFVWGIVGLFTFPLLAKYGMPEGTVFLDDVLMPFVNAMVGAAVHFEWLTEPEPAKVSPSIVKYVWWGSGILGVLCACGRAGEVVEDEPTDEEVIVDL